MGASDSNSVSVDDLALAFHESLLGILPIRNGSDRTCIRKVARFKRDEAKQAALAARKKGGTYATAKR